MAEDKDIEQKITLTFGTNADEQAKKVDNLAGKTDEVTESQKKATKSTKDQKDAFNELSPALSGAINGIKATGKALLALAMNPIVLTLTLIVGALALLFKAFISTKAGGEQLDRVMSGISAVIDVVRDRILKAGETIVKFFSGDFKGALATGLEAVSGFGDEVQKEFNKAANATKALQEVTDAVRDLGVSRAKLNRDLAESKEIITDETASYAEKKKAIEGVKVAEAAQTKQELENARKKLDAIVILNDLSDSDAEALDRKAQAETELINLERQSAEDRRQIRRTETRADKEEETRIKTISDARKAAYKVRLDQEKEILKARQEVVNSQLGAEQSLLKSIQDLNDKSDQEKLDRQKERDLAEIALLEKKGVDVRGLLVLNNEKFETLQAELEIKNAEAKAERDKIAADKKAEANKLEAEKQKEIDLAVFKQKEILEQSRVNLVEKSLGFLSVIAGKNKALQKASIIAENAVSIGRSLIANAAGNVQASAVAAPLLVNPVTAGPAAAALAAATINNNVSTAIGVASSIAATAKALSALGGGGSGGSGGASGAPATPRGGAAPQVGFQNSQENQIGTTLAGNINEQPPVQAYVVSSEVTTAQSLDRNRINANSF
jgi:hypothetical protein